MSRCDQCSLKTQLTGSVCGRWSVCGWLCACSAPGPGQGKDDVTLNQGLAANTRSDLATR